MAATKIIILGTGGNCIDILDTINELNLRSAENPLIAAGFLDDNDQTHGESFYGVNVLGSLSDAEKFGDCKFVNGIGSPENFRKKCEIIAKTKIADEDFITLVHPTASVSKMAKIGRGTVIFQNVTVTSNVSIGDHVIILPNSVISHDCVIGNYTSIAGGVCISGGVLIGESCYLGTNCSIKGGLTVGKNSLIGMGSVVLENIAEGCVVAGNPAKILRETKL